MSALVYVSSLSGSHRSGGDEVSVADQSYVVVVPERRRDEVTRALRQAFTEVVNTVVGDVFIVRSGLARGQVEAAIRNLAGPEPLDIEVVYVEEMNWEAISRRPQDRSAVA